MFYSLIAVIKYVKVCELFPNIHKVRDIVADTPIYLEDWPTLPVAVYSIAYTPLLLAIVITQNMGYAAASYGFALILYFLNFNQGCKHKFFKVT